MKMGRLDEAHIDAEKVLRKEPDNEEANKIYSMIEPVKEKLQEVDSFIKSRQHEAAIHLLGELLEQVKIYCRMLLKLYLQPDLF